MKSLLLSPARVRLSNHRLPGRLFGRWQAALWGCALALAALGLTPCARALDPAPGGGYPGNNTALGNSAAANLDTSNGLFNTAIGTGALQATTDGDRNTAVGDEALGANTGSYNTATGQASLFRNTTGTNNTADGNVALYSNTTGVCETATGYAALFSTTTGGYNTADGVNALYSNTTGTSSTATGFQALYYSTTGSYNTADGWNALFSNTTGFYNTASGEASLYNNTSGTSNTAVGSAALTNSTTASGNTAVGASVLQTNTTGANNTAVGYGALDSATTGSNNIALGQDAGSKIAAGSDNIDIGNTGGPNDQRAIRIGNSSNHLYCFIAGINGSTIAGGVPVVIDPSTGRLGNKTSSERFKEAIRPMAESSEAILSLEPVSFRYKPEYDPAGGAQFGLIAEQVAKVDPNLVARDARGQIYTVRYDEINAMLLNEFLKEHRKVEAQQDTIAELRAGLEAQQRELHDLAALVHAHAAPPDDGAPRP